MSITEPPKKKTMGHAVTLWAGTSEVLPTLQYVTRDNSWLKLLPEGSRVISADGYSSSLWSQMGKVVVRMPDDSIRNYFIKLTENQVGRVLAEGEYESSKWLYKAIPDNMPCPVGWGTFESSKDVHFFMTEFISIHDEEYPPRSEITKLVADMHLRSQDLSPNGQYGFHVTTLNGPAYQYTKWNPSWEGFFTEFLKDLFAQERARAGPSAEFDDLSPALFNKVIPRLLRPLETGGNTIRPTLIHGDLYHGNTARDVKDGRPMLFDAGSLWAHNEYELHCWLGNTGRFIFDDEYVQEYFSHFPASAPAEDWRDRRALYYLASTLIGSICWPDTGRYRKETVDNIRLLVDRFPEGYTGRYQRKGLDLEDGVSGTKVEVDKSADLMRPDSAVNSVVAS